MAGNTTNYLSVVENSLEPILVDLAKKEGKLISLFRDDSRRVQFLSSDYGVQHRIKGQWAGGHYLIDSTLGDAGETEFAKTYWLPSNYYNVAEFSNLGDLYTSNPSTSVVRQSTDTIFDMLRNAMLEISWFMYGNGAGELAYLSGTTQSYSGTTLTLSNVGGQVADQVHRFAGCYVEPGMVIDIIDATTHKPIAGGSKLTVLTRTTVPDDSDVVLTLSGATGTVTGIAAGDYLVKHGEIDGTTGASKNIFGLTAFAAAGNPTSLAIRHLGQTDVSTAPWFDVAYNGDAGGGSANNVTEIQNCVRQIDTWRNTTGDMSASVVLTNSISARKLSDGLDKGTNYLFNETVARYGGFSSVQIHFGQWAQEMLIDDQAPHNRVWVMTQDAFKYCVIEPLHFPEKEQNMINFGKDVTRVTARMVHTTYCNHRKGLAMAYDLS
jgi:hypothetical protein